MKKKNLFYFLVLAISVIMVGCTKKNIDYLDMDTDFEQSIEATFVILEEKKEVDLDYSMIKGDDGTWRFEHNFVLPIQAAYEL